MLIRSSVGIEMTCARESARSPADLVDFEY